MLHACRGRPDNPCCCPKPKAPSSSQDVALNEQKSSGPGASKFGADGEQAATFTCTRAEDWQLLDKVLDILAAVSGRGHMYGRPVPVKLARYLQWLKADDALANKGSGPSCRLIQVE